MTGGNTGDARQASRGKSTFRAAVRSGKEIGRKCIYCADDDSILIAESTRLDGFEIPPSFDISSQRSTVEYDSRETLGDNCKFPFLPCTWCRDN